MSGIHGHLFNHLARRGFEAVQTHFQQPSPEYMQQLQHDAELYENAGPQMEVKPAEMLPVLITGLITLLIVASVSR